MNGNIIDINNIGYQKLNNKKQRDVVINYINNETILTLCEYAGNDTNIGVAHYKFLKDL